VAGDAAAVDADLAEVEEHSEVELALIDVLADLRLVRRQVLRGALGVEHEAMGDQVDRREVRLQAAAPELREVGVLRKAQQPLEDLSEDRLRQELLVLPRARRLEVGPERQRPVEALVATRLGVEQGREPLDVLRKRHVDAPNRAECVGKPRSAAVTSGP